MLQPPQSNILEGNYERMFVPSRITNNPQGTEQRLLISSSSQFQTQTTKITSEQLKSVIVKYDNELGNIQKRYHKDSTKLKIKDCGKCLQIFTRIFYAGNNDSDFGIKFRALSPYMQMIVDATSQLAIDGSSQIAVKKSRKALLELSVLFFQQEDKVDREQAYRFRKGLRALLSVCVLLEIEEKDQIHGLFKQYYSKEYIEKLLLKRINEKLKSDIEAEAKNLVGSTSEEVNGKYSDLTVKFTSKYYYTSYLFFEVISIKGGKAGDKVDGIFERIVNEYCFLAFLKAVGKLLRKRYYLSQPSIGKQMLQYMMLVYQQSGLLASSKDCLLAKNLIYTLSVDHSFYFSRILDRDPEFMSTNIAKFEAESILFAIHTLRRSLVKLKSERQLKRKSPKKRNEKKGLGAESGDCYAQFANQNAKAMVETFCHILISRTSDQEVNSLILAQLFKIIQLSNRILEIDLDLIPELVNRNIISTLKFINIKHLSSFKVDLLNEMIQITAELGALDPTVINKKVFELLCLSMSQPSNRRDLGVWRSVISLTNTVLKINSADLNLTYPLIFCCLFDYVQMVYAYVFDIYDQSHLEAILKCIAGFYLQYEIQGEQARFVKYRRTSMFSLESLSELIDELENRIIVLIPNIILKLVKKRKAEASFMRFLVPIVYYVRSMEIKRNLLAYLSKLGIQGLDGLLFFEGLKQHSLNPGDMWGGAGRNMTKSGLLGLRLNDKFDNLSKGALGGGINLLSLKSENEEKVVETRLCNALIAGEESLIEVGEEFLTIRNPLGKFVFWLDVDSQEHPEKLMKSSREGEHLPAKDTTEAVVKLLLIEGWIPKLVSSVSVKLGHDLKIYHNDLKDLDMIKTQTVLNIQIMPLDLLEQNFKGANFKDSEARKRDFDIFVTDFLNLDSVEDLEKQQNTSTNDSSGLVKHHYSIIKSKRSLRAKPKMTGKTSSARVPQTNLVIVFDNITRGSDFLGTKYLSHQPDTFEIVVKRLEGSEITPKYLISTLPGEECCQEETETNFNADVCRIKNGEEVKENDPLQTQVSFVVAEKNAKHFLRSISSYFGFIQKGEAGKDEPQDNLGKRKKKILELNEKIRAQSGSSFSKLNFLTVLKSMLSK